MFFADLTPHSYDELCPAPKKHVLMVGWLSCEHPFQTGEVSDVFLRTLRRSISSPVIIPEYSEMGFHECEFCSPREEGESVGAWVLGNRAPPRNMRGLMGTGELWVPSASDLVYVAPVLVAHYVEVHSYLPPQEFMDAVVALQVPLAPNNSCRGP
jgi:hypothetical protein